MKTNWETMFSMSEEHELQFIRTIVEQARGLSSFAIDLGSYHGKTAALLAEVYNTVFAIDLYGDLDDALGEYESIG